MLLQCPRRSGAAAIVNSAPAPRVHMCLPKAVTWLFLWLISVAVVSVADDPQEYVETPAGQSELQSLGAVVKDVVHNLWHGDAPLEQAPAGADAKEDSRFGVAPEEDAAVRTSAGAEVGDSPTAEAGAEVADGEGVQDADAARGKEAGGAAPPAPRQPSPAALLLKPLGPWAPLTLLWGLVGCVCLLLWTVRAVYGALRLVLDAINERWRTAAPPYLADVPLLKYATCCMLLIVSVACAFPVVVHHYALQNGMTEDCRPGWTYFSGRCFTYLAKGFPARDVAEHACNDEGASLAAAKTNADNKFLKDLVLSVGNASSDFDFTDDFIGPKRVYGMQVCRGGACGCGAAVCPAAIALRWF